MRQKNARLKYPAVFFILPALFMFSCGDIKTVQIWTDRPEFALYGEYFNTVQDQYKVSVRYMEYPVSVLNRTNSPDIIIASWLKNSSTETYFKSLNNLFGTKKLSRSIFYPRLLAIGRIDRNQYLIPVSFNIPALIFSGGRKNEISNQFTIDFSEVKKISLEFNAESGGSYTRMGFSPLWNSNFLLTAAFMSGASFREDDAPQSRETARASVRIPLAWDSAALEQSLVFINEWTNNINTSCQMEEDFTFKYFFESPERLIQSGRIFFSFIESNELFLLGEAAKNIIDFRWIMEQEMIPITEDMVMLGIPKWSKSQAAARAFIMWFCNIENQRLLLEYSKTNRINENIFGICGGFSALSSVTEQVYPQYYPELLGRMPPADNLMPPNIMPANWATIKEKVILPYLSERARSESADSLYPLERRVSDWVRINR